MRIFVGCSSNDAIPREYIDDCTKLLEVILKDNDLVFGACNKGLMGVAYKTAKKNNNKVTGICPEIYKKSFDDLDCDKEEITTSIIDSTMKIYRNSDAIIILPGGFGTIFEFFTANYCKICKEIDIPIILYNSCGFFDELISFINNGMNKKLVKESEAGNYLVANNVDEVLDILNNRT